LGEHFQGDAATRGELLSFVHRAHTAAPEHSEQPVTAELTREFRRPVK
jgi:hypothetical protein